jgi:hypothetical protein
MSEKDVNKEKLFLQIERKEQVCQHIYDAVRSGNRISVYPLCIQMYEDGYWLYWYCDECARNYGMSVSGTYVYDDDESDAEGYNPFSKFLIEQDGWLVKRSELAAQTNQFSIERPLEEGSLERVPFSKIKAH